VTLRVGLTGGLASGKSTLLGRLAALGIPVLDADAVVKDLYRRGAAGSRAVADEFGPEFLGADGAVDRARLAARVFGDPAALARLNARIHPLVHAAQAAWFRGLEAAGRPLGVVEATLLVETGGRQRFDVLVAVSAPERIRSERALSRHPQASSAEIERRIRAQIPDPEREKVADIVISNDGDEASLLVKADELARNLLDRARHEIAGLK
jgi:dephospho-CoA kinase